MVGPTAISHKCYVQTKDIIIHPLIKYLSNDVIFIDDQSFESNLASKESRPLVMTDFHVAPQMLFMEYIVFIVVLFM